MSEAESDSSDLSLDLHRKVKMGRNSAYNNSTEEFRNKKVKMTPAAGNAESERDQTFLLNIEAKTTFEGGKTSSLAGEVT